MKNTKRVQRLGTIIPAVFLLAVMMLNICACHDSAYDDKVGIAHISIMAATGNKENSNCVYINRGYKGSNLENMTGETAIKLKDEILSLPDVLGDESEPEAYIIDLAYYDENYNEAYVTKKGYGQFPVGWNLIVSYANTITDRDKLTSSTHIVTVDARLLQREFGLTQDMLPEGVTVEQYIEDTHLTYFSLYGHYYDTKFMVMNYKYDYYNLASHRITEDEEAAPSDSRSLKEYAESNLDSISSVSDISVTGFFMDYGFEIVRFDCFDTWKKDKGVSGTSVNNDKTMDIVFDIDLHMEGMHSTKIYYVYVDPSNRFLIITRCEEYDVINAYFNR